MILFEEGHVLFVYVFLWGGDRVPDVGRLCSFERWGVEFLFCVEVGRVGGSFCFDAQVMNSSRDGFNEDANDCIGCDVDLLSAVSSSPLMASVLFF